MAQTTTQNRILQLIYGELDKTESKDLLDMIEANPKWLAYYKEMKTLKENLPMEKENPNDTSIHIIGEYSHDSHTETV